LYHCRTKWFVTIYTVPYRLVNRCDSSRRRGYGCTNVFHDFSTNICRTKLVLTSSESQPNFKWYLITFSTLPGITKPPQIVIHTVPTGFSYTMFNGLPYDWNRMKMYKTSLKTFYTSFPTPGCLQSDIRPICPWTVAFQNWRLWVSHSARRH